MLQHLGLHHRVKQYLVSAFDGSQHIETLHQVGHSHIIMTLGLLLTSLQQILMQQIVGMAGIERNLVSIVGIGVYPNGILASFKHTTKDGRQRARPQLRICHRKHIGHQRRVGHIPVEIVCPPFRIEPPLVQITIGLGGRNICMRLYTLLKVLPHIEDDSLVIPPVDIVFLGLFEIMFPSMHHCLSLIFISLFGHKVMK